MDERGQEGEAASRPRPGGLGRAAKLVPPRDPNGMLERAALEARVAAGADRRLTIVVPFPTVSGRERGRAPSMA